MSGLLSGVLPAVFSAGNKLKRQIGGLLSDPVGTVQQQVGLLNDKAGAFNQLTAQAAQEHVNSLKTGGGMGRAQMKLANTLADSYNPMGMVVWHGSPHKFSKFDSSKIGTGEGAQAYGHGLYFAESPDVAQNYADFVKRVTPTQLKDEKSLLLQMKTDNFRRYKPDEIIAQEKLVQKMADRIESKSLYKVDLPDDAIAKMLDWDKPLSQQAPEVQTALQNSGLMKYADEYFKTNRKAAPTGADLHDFLKYSGYDQGELAAKMAEQGLPGIRYLDGVSRGAGSGTSNFVVFPGNEGLLTILERNGKPLE